MIALITKLRKRCKSALWRVLITLLDYLSPHSERAIDIRSFPIKHDTGDLWFSRLLFEQERQGYCALFYNVKLRWDSRPPGTKVVHDGAPFTAEVCYVTRHEDTASLRVTQDAVIPFGIKGRPQTVLSRLKKVLRLLLKGRKSTLTPNEKVRCLINSKGFDFYHFLYERYYYLRLKAGDSLEIQHKDADIFLGKPLYLRSKTKRKIVLPIFVDTLSAAFFDFQPFDIFMPKTYKFFSKGTWFDNCYTNGEWTIPTQASINSSLYTQHHGMFHYDRFPKIVPSDIKLMSEYFQENGYITFQACSCHAKNPGQGYVRGFDRTVYHGFYNCAEIASEFFDFVQGVGEANLFVWLSFFDMHPFRMPSLAVQPHLDPFSHASPTCHNSSFVVEHFDIGIVHRYLAEAKRIDFYLGQIFDYVTSNYDESEFLVCLFADHGHSYLSKEPGTLKNARIHTPLLFRGGGVPQATTDELVQNTDILPSLLHFADIELSQKVDGRLPKLFGNTTAREYVFAETLYPGKKYECVFKGDDFRYFFESESKVANDGKVDISDIHYARGECSNEAIDQRAHIDSFYKILSDYFATSRIQNRS